jgi:hypothetical protein
MIKLLKLCTVLECLLYINTSLQPLVPQKFPLRQCVFSAIPYILQVLNVYIFRGWCSVAGIQVFFHRCSLGQMFIESFVELHCSFSDVLFITFAGHQVDPRIAACGFPINTVRLTISTSLHLLFFFT